MMRRAALMAVAVALGTITVAVARDVPSCVTTAQKSEVRRESGVPAPRLAPAEGPAGADVHITTDGFPPESDVILVGIYGEGDCTIVGFGDQFLARTTADVGGRVDVTVEWPAMFDPLFGRQAFEPTPLPLGRYYIIALPCASRGACSLSSGSVPGGPFTMVERNRSPAAPLAAASAVVAAASALGWVLFRRR